MATPGYSSSASLRSSQSSRLHEDAEYWLGSLIKTLPHYAAVVDREMGWLAFNDSYRQEFTRLFGGVPEIGKKLPEALGPGESHDAVLIMVQRALDGESFTEIQDLGEAGGHRGTFRQMCGPVLGPDDEILGAYMMARRVQTLGDTEAELKDEQARFRGIFAYSGIGMALVSKEGQFFRVNRRLTEMLGYTAEELCEKTFGEITHPDDLKADLEQLEKLSRGEIPYYEMEKRYFHADGSVIWIHLNGFMVPDDEGKPNYYVAQIQDITRRKLIEQMLTEARDAALAADVAKSNFLAVMSHEIRTPLNAVLGFADALKHSGLNEEQKKYLEYIETGGTDLLRLVNDVLDFSKIESGSLQMEHVQLELDAIIDDIFSSQSLTADAKGLALEWEIEPDCPRQFLGDPHRLKQVLLNLVSNAIKFTEKGSVRLKAARREGDGSGAIPLLQIQVTDTGIGISPEAQEKVFSPFVQADSSTTRRFGGTGLGLSISSRIIQSMGGEISVVSRPGEGSTFTILLPMHLPTHGQARIIGPQPPDAPLSLANCRILLVDDNAANREFLSNRLRRLGLKVWISESANAAMELLQNSGQVFHAVVTDLMMPNVDGFDLAKKIRDDPQMQHIKLILVTSLPLHLLPRKPDAQLFDKVLSKPISIQQLHDVLQPLIGRSSECGFLDEEGEEGDQPDPVQNQPVITQPANEPSFADKFPAKILVAEDNPANLQLLINLLSRMGYSSPRITEDGETCLEHWRKSRPDILLLDVHMPGMNGLQVAQIIRQEEHDDPLNRYTRIFALTADALQGDREKCLNAGMDDYLPKPFKQHDLEQLFLRHLEN